MAYEAFSEPPPESKVRLSQITDEIFDNTDNMLVIFLETTEELESRRAEISGVVKLVTNDDALRRVKLFYNLRKDEDPVVPAGEGGEGDEKSLKLILYKGQRKTVLRGQADDALVERIRGFFVPVSEELGEEKKLLAVPFVSHWDFGDEVLKSSSAAGPVLVQMYEDTCFLCFLMRPFINSLALLLAERRLPLAIKRLNLERNDFPDGCPVARGTPTFAIFRGRDAPPAKWDEFKPPEVVDRLESDHGVSGELLAIMRELQETVPRRLQLFMQLILWNVEMGKLEALVAGAGVPAGKAEEESSFNETISELMSKDMLRTDTLPENLQYLQNEVDEVEHDVVLVGTYLAEQIMKKEQLEAEARR